MTTRDREFLRANAAALAPAGCRVSKLLLWLLAEQETCEQHLQRLIAATNRMAERIYDQSEILAARACRPCTHPCA